MQEEQTVLDLIITTPRGVKFEEKADFVSFRALDGERGVLPGHAPLITALGDGILKVHLNGTEQQLAVFGGIAEIDERKIQIYSTIAQKPEEIDVKRAAEDRERALAALKEQKEDVAMQRLRGAAYRALVRLNVSSSVDFDESDD